MAKYCRYCEFMYRGEKEYYCPMKDKILTEKYAKHTNTCDCFQLNPIDAIRQNVSGYQPTGVKPVAFGGLGEQIKMEGIEKVRKRNGQKK